MAPPNKQPTARLGKDGPEIPRVGFGMMGLGSAYGAPPPDEERLKVLDRAWELGSTNWDTADAYGDCEDLTGKWFLAHPERREDIFLATKFGLKQTGDPTRGFYGFVVDSSPEYARQCIESSLKKLNVDYIDLYYIHRIDDVTPIEHTITELVKMKEEGKIKYIGISECSSATLRRAHAVHPIAAIQNEYNPWSLEIENESGTNLLATARELGVSIFAYSPMGRGLLSGQYRSVEDFEETDMRRGHPRFVGDNFAKNLEVVDKFVEVAKRKGVTAGQVAIAWVLAQGDDFFPIPGTKKIKYIEENAASAQVHLSKEEEAELRAIVDAAELQGDRGALFSAFADSVPL